jgi:putative ABC transport system permease protein
MKLMLSVIGLALATVRENKVRSFLTVLGVVIGTGTIIAVGSILAGLDGAVTGVIRSMGTNTAVVFKMRMGPSFGGRTNEEKLRKPLTYENAVSIAERCPSVEHATAFLMLGGFGPGPMSLQRVRYKGNDYLGPQLGGTEEGYAASGQAEMLAGRFFTDMENRHHLPVVDIGEDIYKALFGVENAIGKQITVGGAELEVIGVMRRPANSLPGQDDNRVLVPYFTLHKLFPSAKENMLIIAAKQGRLPEAMDEIRAVLRQERRVSLSAPDNFFISTADQMVEDFRSVTSVVTLVMVVLSSIGLLVGGIGVMNIMLVSVTERTREIGVRKAVGARRSDIIVQFLTEAVVLTGLGGLTGMFFGWLVSLASHLAFPNLPTAVPLWAAALGIVVSVAIGVFFGIWPASKAARLDPVEALRYE